MEPSFQSESEPRIKEFSGGHTTYADLPPQVQARLRARQAGEIRPQLRLPMGSSLWNYVFTIIPFLWFWYLIAQVSGKEWNEEQFYWYVSVSVLVAIIIAFNIVAIIQWHKSTLKPAFYVTALYVIKTWYDVISVEPVWAIRDVSVVHNLRNGIYQNSAITLEFSEHTEEIILHSKQDVEDFHKCDLLPKS